MAMLLLFRNDESPFRRVSWGRVCSCCLLFVIVTVFFVQLAVLLLHLTDGRNVCVVLLCFLFTLRPKTGFPHVCHGAESDKPSSFFSLSILYVYVSRYST